MNPHVSIILPSFNRAHLITETLDSILSQSYQNWECIVIDDGSDDATEEVVQGYRQNDARIAYAKRPQNRPKGANACRNYGLNISRGELINWFDSDDLMTISHLEMHVQNHQNSDCAATVSSANVFQQITANHIRKWDNIKPTQNIIDEMIANHVLWPINCVVWKKSALPSQPFMEELASSQEWTFHLSQLIDGIHYKIIEQATCLVREHQQRTGKDISAAKSFSTFSSRRYIMQLLQQRKMLSHPAEKGLLKDIFTALRQSIQYKHYQVANTILRYLTHQIRQSRYSINIFKVLMLAYPIYKLSGKGEKLFKI